MSGAMKLIPLRMTQASRNCARWRVNTRSKSSLCAPIISCLNLCSKEPVAERAARLEKLGWIFGRCEIAGIARIVLPFVDNSKLETDSDLDDLAALLKQMAPKAAGLEIHLETSLPPARFASLLEKTGEPSVKVNYDSGNSASLGFRAEEEFAAYGAAIGSVHIKDRLLHGGTVPLGQGNADLAASDSALKNKL